MHFLANNHQLRSADKQPDDEPVNEMFTINVPARSIQSLSQIELSCALVPSYSKLLFSACPENFQKVSVCPLCHCCYSVTIKCPLYDVVHQNP